MMHQLSNKERELIKLLRTVEGDSMWAIAIRNVLGEGLAWKVRRLIAELKSQRADDPQTMRLIIGQDAAEKLQRI